MNDASRFLNIIDHCSVRMHKTKNPYIKIQWKISTDIKRQFIRYNHLKPFYQKHNTSMHCECTESVTETHLFQRKTHCYITNTAVMRIIHHPDNDISGGCAGCTVSNSNPTKGTCITGIKYRTGTKMAIH